MRFKPWIIVLLVCLLFLAACSPLGSQPAPTPTHAPVVTRTPGSSPTSVAGERCPAELSDQPTCYTPRTLRMAYGVESLTQRGYTGKGQTIIDIVSYGSPTLQQDMDVFDRQFGLPAIKIQVLAPLGTVPFDPANREMMGWALETELDVQVIHAIAPDANIIVMTSPVDETEGTIGLPQFLQLEQYAVAHHLGQIFSQSYAASEATLGDQAGQQLIRSYSEFYRQITTQQGITVVSGSGDNGATDYADVKMTHLASSPTVNFPADVPWVTAVGGTRLLSANSEDAWPESGGGLSKFFAQPDFQKTLPAQTQTLLNGKRGLPDIAADADPETAMANYIQGRWTQIGGTSAATPLWTGIIAVGNQMAGHPLGFINPGLYKLGTSPLGQQTFRDITNGDNSVDRGSVQVKGYQAGPGWDAVTGWGAPQADHLLPSLIAALKLNA